MNASTKTIETRNGEWLMAYSPVGNVCHFTRDHAEAKRVDMNYGPSRDWAKQALRIVKSVYGRQEARIT